MSNTVTTKANDHRRYTRPDVMALTPREQQVVALVEAGKSRKEIAEELGLSANSITRMLTTIREKQPVAHLTGRV
jgi:DNA-binding NarL/FixJ family response regulator